MKKYLGLVSIILNATVLQFYESSGIGIYTNSVAEFLSPIAMFGLGGYVGLSIVKDFIED